jgi:hypothetical protein
MTTSRVVRTRWQTLAAGLLAWNGAVAIFYAGLVPLPPVSTTPVPLVGQVLGVATLIAAAGVARRMAWARMLGVGLTLIGLAGEVARVADPATRYPPGFVVGTVIGVLLLWLLLRRWPRDPAVLGA